MRVIPTLPFGAPGCAVLPLRDDVTEKGGFVDTGHELPGVDPHVYVSAAAVREMARMLDEPLTNAELAQAKARIAELEAELNEANRFIDSIAGVAKNGFEIRKQRGRKPKEQVEA